jgi:hypothetical protein
MPTPKPCRPAHIWPGEAWSDRALADLKSMPDERRNAWNALLVHCESSKTGQPSPRWVTLAREHIAQVRWADFKRRVLEWFPLVDKPRTQPVERRSPLQPDPNVLIGYTNGDILKGLVWFCSLKEDPEIARAMTALAISSYRKVPQIGPRLVRVGNACVWALGVTPGNEGVGQLAILRVRVKFSTAQKGIEKALNATAERVGVPREELEEMSVPAYGMSEVGIRREQLGEFVAELAVVSGTAGLRWLRPDGKPQKSMPAAAKKDYADDVTELKTAAKDIQRMLGAQRERLDALNLAQKSWPLALWRERYLDHPLVGTLARRLIWVFRDSKRRAEGIWHDGELVDCRSKPIGSLSSDTSVELWHPIGLHADEIVAWRRWLEEHEVQQPFKQAHREVYLLTDAERSTRVYSNRFAAHILRQHQFNSLCAVRGWNNRLRLMVDAEFPPATLLLPKWNLCAEFWVEGAGEDPETDINEASVFHYLVTDQVRFYSISDGDVPVPLEDIPPLVLSEVMRDVDLFVGVCSVGNDPNWADGGPDGRYGDYWAGYAFGGLTETAKTRRQVLERLIPRLAIADRCSFTERFLIVRGDLRTYKIHLGSGNIRMEPNDQYLCIVKAPPADGANRVFLPFEGDGMLAIILSKALLLAEDKKIKDETIVRQIKTR